MCNKYFRTSGPSTKYFFGLSETFEKHGHQVIHFSMQDPRNEPSPYADYFASQVDFNQRLTPWRYAREFARAIYCLEARAKAERLVRDTKPDIVMLFNIYHHLSPSILEGFRKYSLPTVYLLEDFFLICPNYRLYAHGAVCERCKNGHFSEAVRQRCFQESTFRSLAAAGVAYVHKWLNLYRRSIDAYIAPSQFVLDKFVDHGFEQEKITVIPHGLPVDHIVPRFGGDDYIVYLGHLEPWKGTSTLFQAMRQLPDIRLFFLGDGKSRSELEREGKRLNLTNMEFKGYVTGPIFHELVRNSRFVVVPSEWYEVFGTVTWEAFAYGKPVIGSRIGATPELVKEGETGVLFEPGNAADLAEKIRYLYENLQQTAKMGKNGRLLVETSLSLDHNHEATMALFDKLLADINP